MFNIPIKTWLIKKKYLKKKNLIDCNSYKYRYLSTLMFNKVSTGKRYPYAVIIPNTYD